MKNVKNPNHPKKGSNITVSPIRSEDEIKRIKKYLKHNTRNYLLFTFGINNDIRISDLLKLKVKDVMDLSIGETLEIKESKTGKPNVLMINKAVYKALQAHLKEANPKDGDYLFKSQKGQNKPLTKFSVNLMIKSWCSDLGIKGNYGCHSLRKTFGYIQRTKYGVDFSIICKRFNHSSPSITMRYLGITDKEVNGILLNEI